MFRQKVAIIGAGFMGGAHAEALRRIGVQVCGILGADNEETYRASEQLGIPKAYVSFEEVCTDTSVDVLHICTPNYLHYPMVLAALKAGKHVLCEKPLANTSAESAELMQIARANGLVGAVNYSVRFYPLNQEARARIQMGQIGEPRVLHAEYCQDWLYLPTDWNWRLDPVLGGDLRVVGDIGTHVLDMLTWLTGLEVKAVMADMATFWPVRQKPQRAVDTFASKLSTANETEPVEIHTEDYAGILLRFENGARGVLTLSQVNAGRKNDFWWEINGSKASLSWHQERPNEMWVGYREKANEILLKDPALMQPEARPYSAYPGGHAEGYPDTFARHFTNFYSYLTASDFDKAPDFPTFEDGHREMMLCEAIQLSAAEQRWVEL